MDAGSGNTSDGNDARTEAVRRNSAKDTEKEEPPNVELASTAPAREDVGWRKFVRNFTASWFTVNMGTGIVSILLHNLPYNATWVLYVSYAFFTLNIALFFIFLATTAMRYILYPEIWGVMIRHQTMSLFLGCIPMGFATIITMVVLVCSSWGNWAIYMAWGLWWADVVVSLVCCLTVPFVVVHHHKTPLESITATLLLPVVPVVVISATGGVVAEALPNPGHAMTTVVVSYLLWGLGQVFSFFILTMYFLRLQVHDLPPRDVIVSVILPIGVYGQGGFGVLQLGRASMITLASSETFGSLGMSGAHAGEGLYIVGLFIALLFWGAAIGWLSFALLTFVTTKKFPFNMGWWGFTFPLGVCTTCVGLLAKELASPFLKVVTMILSLSVLVLWIVVAGKTLQLVMAGELFFAPCLRDLRRSDHLKGNTR